MLIETNEAGSREAKRAVGERSEAAAGRAASEAAPDPELVERPKRRRFSAEYKLRILAEADACREQDLAQGDVAAEVLLIGTLDRQDFDGVVWENVLAAPGLVQKLRGRIGLKGKGARPELFAIQLSDDEESREAIEQVSRSLGWRPSAGDVPGVETPIKVQVQEA